MTEVPTQDAVATGDALLASDLAKSFGPTRALRSATLRLSRGEIHAIVGENGSGKSTLVKILAGVHRPDCGSLQIEGTAVPGFRAPRESIDAGIATVFQEVLVVGSRSLLENLWLGAEGKLTSRLDAATKRRRGEQILEALLGTCPPLDQPVERLTLSERQTCGIARALLRDPRVLILDESTSALDVATRDRLFDELGRRAAAGCAVIFISHRMDEIERIGDRVTVMRSGDTVATVSRGEATVAELVRLMTGAEHLVEQAPRVHRAAADDGAVLRCRGMRLAAGRRPFDVTVHAGELVGLAGLEGHGQDVFLKALWGSGAAAGDVLRVRDDVEQPITSPRQAAATGIAYVARERRAESLFASKSVAENFGVVTLTRDTRGTLLQPRATIARLREYVTRLHMKIGRPDDLITTLSGGNQQKVVVARWLATGPAVLLLNDPTRGVDLGAKRDLYQLLRELTDGGMAVVMLSTEVDEHVELMDRVLVFREQELAAQLRRDQLARETLVGAFFGEVPA